jgi:hypothetical protein
MSNVRSIAKNFTLFKGLSMVVQVAVIGSFLPLGGLMRRIGG